MKPIKRTMSGDRFFQRNPMLHVNRVTEAFHLSLHAHEFIELAYVGEGQGFHYIEDEVHPVKRGRLYVIPIGISHVFRPSSADAVSKPLVIYNCIFSPRLVEELLPSVADVPIAGFMKDLMGGSLPLLAVEDVDAEIESLFLALYREYGLTQSGSVTYMYTLLLQLLITIYRLTHKDHVSASSREERFLQVLRYMEQHYDTELTLTRLSERFQWSERQLQRLFKRHADQTFHHYLQGVRIRKSCERLRTSKLTITAIAESVGYRDTNFFIAAFKRLVGETPSSYRKRHL